MSAAGELDLRREVEAFAALIESLPPDRLQPQVWGAREILSHLAYWHRRYVELVKAALAGAPLELPRVTLKALNAAAVQAGRDRSTAELLAQLRRAQADLEVLDSDPRVGGVRIRLRAGSTAWPWPELRRRIAGHVRRHAAAVRRGPTG